MKNIFLFIMAVISILSIADAKNEKTKGIVLLMPGTLNSIAPGHVKIDNENIEVNNYFSEDIVHTIEKNNYITYTIDHLLPTGSLKENGKIAFTQFYNWLLKRNEFKDLPIHIISHSAGGFYSLYLKQLDEEHQTNFNIKTITFINTPLKGSIIADNYFTKLLDKDFAKSISKLIDLRGLIELSKDNVKDFYRELNFLKPVKMFSVNSSQKNYFTLNTLQVFNSRYISPALDIISRLVNKKSDGVVSNDSSDGSQLIISGQKITHLGNLGVSLDHMEQVLDYKIFPLIGIYNAEYVKYSQIKLYQKLLSSIETH